MRKLEKNLLERERNEGKDKEEEPSKQRKVGRFRRFLLVSGIVGSMLVGGAGCGDTTIDNYVPFPNDTVTEPDAGAADADTDVDAGQDTDSDIVDGGADTDSDVVDGGDADAGLDGGVDADAGVDGGVDADSDIVDGGTGTDSDVVDGGDADAGPSACPSTYPDFDTGWLTLEYESYMDVGGYRFRYQGETEGLDGVVIDIACEDGDLPVLDGVIFDNLAGGDSLDIDSDRITVENHWSNWYASNVSITVEYISSGDMDGGVDAGDADGGVSDGGVSDADTDTTPSVCPTVTTGTNNGLVTLDYPMSVAGYELYYRGQASGVDGIVMDVYCESTDGLVRDDEVVPDVPGYYFTVPGDNRDVEVTIHGHTTPYSAIITTTVTTH
ncbi:hypothetical protein GF318_00635 [Candidatus Micrarchaeota archaeon]|nr:hypothetical protein [Candidatus Micrarchaeota archaeon]